MWWVMSEMISRKTERRSERGEFSGSFAVRVDAWLLLFLADGFFCACCARAGKEMRLKCEKSVIVEIKLEIFEILSLAVIRAASNKCQQKNKTKNNNNPRTRSGGR